MDDTLGEAKVIYKCYVIVYKPEDYMTKNACEMCDDDTTTEKVTISERKLLEKRMLFLKGTIDEESMGKVLKDLHHLDQVSSEDISIYLNTNGGEIYEVFSLHDTIRALRSNVHIIVQGKAFSAGALISALCATGKRQAYPNTTFMMHDISSVTLGKISDMEIDVDEGKRLKKRLIKMLLYRTKIKREELETMFTKDTYFDAKKALSYGIIDEII